QRTISNLRPAHLDDLGLPAALRWYLKETAQHIDLPKINFRLQGSERNLPDSVKTAIFRIVQEAVTNAIKHAQANCIEVTLIYFFNSVDATIQDDGIGIDLKTKQGERRPSWGLLGMQERISLLNGKFELSSEPGTGVVVHVSIPAEERIEEEIPSAP
ncbi:MAG: ATP-binding protein, partial [Chloroflexota bacterium]